MYPKPVDPREAVAAGFMTLLALYCAVRCVLALPPDPLGSLQPVVWVAVGIVLFLVWVAWTGKKVAGRRFGGHGHSDATAADLWRHENGHAKLLRKYGVGVGGQRVYPDGGGGWAGWTEPASWGRFMRLPAVKQIAIYAAGGIAMGSHSHDYLDNANIRIVLKDIPYKDRARTEAEGRALARRDL